jgi:hypothetical protein
MSSSQLFFYFAWYMKYWSSVKEEHGQSDLRSHSSVSRPCSSLAIKFVHLFVSWPLPSCLRTTVIHLSNKCINCQLFYLYFYVTDKKYIYSKWQNICKLLETFKMRCCPFYAYCCLLARQHVACSTVLNTWCAVYTLNGTVFWGFWGDSSCRVVQFTSLSEERCGSIFRLKE